MARVTDSIVSKSFTIDCHDILQQYPGLISPNEIVNLSFQWVLVMVEFTFIRVHNSRILLLNIMAANREFTFIT